MEESKTTLPWHPRMGRCLVERKTPSVGGDADTSPGVRGRRKECEERAMGEG